MYLSIIHLPIPIDLSICISLRVYLLDLSSTSLVCYDSIDGFSVVVILGEEVLGRRALCTYVHRHTHTHILKSVSRILKYIKQVTPRLMRAYSPRRTFVVNVREFTTMLLSSQFMLACRKSSTIARRPFLSPPQQNHSTQIVLPGFGFWVYIALV